MKNNLIEHRKKIRLFVDFLGLEPKASTLSVFTLTDNKKHRPKSVLKFKIFKKAISFSLTNIVTFFKLKNLFLFSVIPTSTLTSNIVVYKRIVKTYATIINYASFNKFNYNII